MAIIFEQPESDPGPLRRAIREHYLADETEALEALMETAELAPEANQTVSELARRLVARVRGRREEQSSLDAFMAEYDLSSEEGVLLMCLAEALLRIPDADTAEKLISDKLGNANWQSHIGKSHSLFVNASTWGLMLTGRIVRVSRDTKRNFMNALNGLVRKSGEPVIRRAIRHAMRIMGHQFVMGRTMKEARARSRKGVNAQYRYSFDMLGEAALTRRDAERYFKSYSDAIQALADNGPYDDVMDAPGISVKLSALHPRYEFSQRGRMLPELAPRLRDLAKQARAANIQLTIDAEEADRLELQLDAFEQVFRDDALAGWNGLGLALQSYLKRAPYVIDWLADLAADVGRQIPLRLVKGAYWDTEIKYAQEQGHAGYPLFTRKANTDVSFLACARRMLDNPKAFYAQFATHNAHTLAYVHTVAGDAPFEFQRLHGMGQALYNEVLGKDRLNRPCRVYAPVGSHEDLLPYLVRRLLENGANTSFVNRISDEKLPVDELVADPVATVKRHQLTSHPRIPLPRDIYGDLRRNSKGVNLADVTKLEPLAEAIAKHAPGKWEAGPVIGGKAGGGEATPITDPADRRRTIGRRTECSAGDVDRAIGIAVKAQPGWDDMGAEKRAAILEKAADLLEERFPLFMALCAREAGKTVGDSVAEIREAADFLRYYPAIARREFAQPRLLRGYTGERNELGLHGKGVFVCISPWNFPLAIFLGQVTAALVAGNAVLAKPAEQTTLIASEAVRVLHDAGVPGDVLHFIPGRGSVVGARATADTRIAGVAFTGSTETARLINRTLADRDGPVATLVAETGGQNAMIVDSSALAEQVVHDAIVSAFGSAGQRCSALRVLYLQDVVADHMLEMLSGAMDELAVGDPALLSTDVGPVIDEDAQQTLNEHRARMQKEAKLLHEAKLAEGTQHGSFFAPCAVEIDSISRLEREVFGPILHVVRYRAKDLDKVIEEINGTGYGLTLGIHSRIETTADYIASRARVGNCYVNRNMVGAIVGVQPFGGEGLSGTGPKAGGPHYLYRFATERTVTVNTAAVGGNASLLALEE